MSSELQDALRFVDLETEMREARRVLRFSRDLEAGYRNDTIYWRRKHYRRSALLALLSYNCYLLVAAKATPDVLSLATVLHLVVVSPLMLLAAFILTRKVSPGIVEAVGTAMPLVFLAQVESVFLASRAADAGHYQYLALFAVMFGNAILRLSFRHAAVVSVIAVATHIVITFSSPNLTSAGAVTASMSMVAAAYITIVSSAIQEGAYRCTWLRRRFAELRTVDLSRDNDKLSRLSRIDPLTGVANRRGFDLAVEQFMARETLPNIPFCVIMLDVDHFKSYNDTYGHGEGDRCLRAVADVLSESLRSERDVLGRFGGEEFVVFAPTCNLDAGVMLAERIRRALVAAAIPHLRKDGGAVVTASLGVAEGSLSSIGAVHDAIALADISLYDAKNNGRNRVEPTPYKKRVIVNEDFAAGAGHPEAGQTRAAG